MTFKPQSTLEWNARTYDAVAAPMTTRGVDAVGRLHLRGDETVLDAGCGTCQVTEALLERLPGGRVIALDGSHDMLDVARERLGGDPRVAFVHADLEQPLPLADPVDAVVSTSTFHWVSDHDRLFGHLAAALRPGGQLVVDCGGAGNTASVLDALGELGVHDTPWTFAGTEETERRLAAAGFVEVRTRLVERPAPIAPEALEEYLTTVILRSFVDELGPEEATAFVCAVAERLPRPEIDYVRLEILARRSR
jgi:trans-aconitate 2-methyltransferase